MVRNLLPLFEPKGIVIAGVSSHPGKFGFVVLHNILSCGYEGNVFAVGRESGELLNQPVLSSIKDVPEGSADLLIVCTPVEANEELIRSAAQLGIKAVFMVTGGYSEAGEKGKEAENRIVSLSNELGLVVAGPNGQGIVSTPANLCAQIVAPYPPKGRISVASQSGNFVSAFQNYANQYGVGISRAVSAGNAADTSIADYLEWFADDEETDVALCYVEGVKNGREFFDRIKNVTKKMPVIMVKGGSTSGGQRAAASHTGSLASDGRVFEGMARQAGITHARTIESAFEAAATFATQPLPSGGDTLVLTTAGGWGVITADAITNHRDLNLISLPEDLMNSINEMLPPRWSHNNPVDLAGGETRDTIPDLLEIAASHPSIDAIIQLGLGIQGNTASLTRSGPFYPDHGLERIVDFHERQEKRYADATVEASQRHGTPVLVASELATADPMNPMVAAIRESGKLCYASADRAVESLGHLVRYSHWLSIQQ